MNMPSRIGRKVRSAAWHGSNRALAALEPLVAGSPPTPLPDPPIFIIGPPRCGSTILYQLLAQRFDLAYFTNRHCRTFGVPALVERKHPSSHQTPTSFTSKYGRTAGMDGPSECGEYWYRFFPRQHVVHTLPRRKMRALRRSLGSLVTAAGRPFLIKNLVCTTRLPVLLRVFPEAIFILVHRDEVEVAHSILDARMKTMGSYDAWWSLRPTDDRAAAGPPEVQVLTQVRETYAFVEHQRKDVASERFIDLDYDALCQDPEGTLDMVSDRLRGLLVDLKVIGPVPDRLPKRIDIRIDMDLYERLLGAARQQ